MVRKVFLDNPSADPRELLAQVTGILKDIAAIESTQDLAEFVEKIGLDAFVDLFTSLGARKVNMARQVKFDVIIEAVTSICFPDYTPSIEQYAFEDKLLYFSTKVKLQHLSNLKRYKLRARFIAGKLFGVGGLASFPSDWRFENKMQDPTAFQYGLKGMFQLIRWLC